MKIKIAFIIPSLRAGGAERVMSFIAKNVDKNRFDTTLLIAGHNKKASYDIEGLKLVFFSKDRVLHAFWPAFKYFQKNKPDIVISAISHVNTLMAFESLWFRKIKFIGREVNVLSVLSKVQVSKKNLLINFLFSIKRSYKLMDIILCQSKDMAADMINNFDVPVDKIRIINNPISDSFKLKERKVDNSVLKFITVGSLVKRKGHDRLLKALSKFNKPFEYVIIGDGKDAEEVFELAHKLKLTNKIKHVAFTKNVSDYLKEADIFLQGSYVEGFPNALLESCAVGTPVLAFNALGGINEIVEDNINGYVADDETDFLDKLNLILLKEWNPEDVRNSVVKKYNKNKILKDYEDLFLSLIEK